ncbi:two-component response regulator ARR2-like isoform X2 [Mangifera indica]|uniref:two-component response regulator ARR2-like isoform X2 n=1 Tax=Mangifera indica TaxID=29780 RepID=UPI001CFA59C9|nr:two-component response regulator ARR2-like isoform X2 [Mangifera indica]
MNSKEAITVDSSGSDILLPEIVGVLLVDSDSLCLTILSKMLLKYGYKVFTAKRATDGLCIIREREGELNLVLAEAHLPDMDKYELLETVGEMSKLPVVSCLFKGAAFYLVKPVTMNDIRNLWQFTFMKKTDRTMASEELSSISSEHDTESQIISKRARREEQKEMEKDVDNSSVLKKPKLIWTEELHNRFLQAIRVLGIDGAHPKKILQYMNVPGLRKENISSHLQKYRLALKRKQDLKNTMNMDYDESNLAAFNLSTMDLQGDSYQVQEMQSLTSFQPKFGSYNYEPKDVSGCLSMPFLGNTHSFNHVGPNCKHGQQTLSNNLVDSTYPCSGFAGKSADFQPMEDSNGEDIFMALSDFLDPGFES